MPVVMPAEIALALVLPRTTQPIRLHAPKAEMPEVPVLFSAVQFRRVTPLDRAKPLAVFVNAAQFCTEHASPTVKPCTTLDPATQPVTTQPFDVEIPELPFWIAEESATVEFAKTEIPVPPLFCAVQFCTLARPAMLMPLPPLSDAVQPLTMVPVAAIPWLELPVTTQSRTIESVERLIPAPPVSPTTVHSMILHDAPPAIPVTAHPADRAAFGGPTISENDAGSSSR